MTRLSRQILPAILTATLCVSASVGAQVRMSLPDSQVFTVKAESGVPEIPFKLINNHLILPLSVNGSADIDVALDTGMPAPGLAVYGGARIEKLNLNIDPSIQARIGGAGGDGARLTAQIAMEEALSIPGLTIDKARVIVMPPLPGLSGYHDGIIGYSLFGRFVVELDYDRQLMRLHDPDSYETPSGAHVLPLAIRNRLPYVTLQVAVGGGEPFDAEVVVDLGASHAISLNTDESDHVTVPDEALTAVLGRGISGPVRGQVGRLASLGLGGAQLDDVLASFPVSEHQNPRGVDSMAGNLGSDVLRRFKTTFDYAGGRLILEPNESFSEPFRFDHSGMRLWPGSELKVEHVIAGSPAEESGIQVDDVVTHINGEAVSGKDYGDVKKTLMVPGEVRLSLRRGEQVLEKKLVLRRLI